MHFTRCLNTHFHTRKPMERGPNSVRDRLGFMRFRAHGPSPNPSTRVCSPHDHLNCSISTLLGPRTKRPCNSGPYVAKWSRMSWPPWISMHGGSQSTKSASCAFIQASHPLEPHGFPWKWEATMEPRHVFIHSPPPLPQHTHTPRWRFYHVSRQFSFESLKPLTLNLKSYKKNRVFHSYSDKF